VWPQQFSILNLFADGSETATLLADQPATTIPATGRGELPIVTLVNANGMGYGLFPAGIDVLQAWDRLLPVQRGVALLNTFDNLLAGTLADTAAYFDLLLGIVQREGDPLLLQLALGQLQFTYNSLLDEEQHSRRTPVMEQALWDALLAHPDSTRTKLVFRYFSALASSPARVQQLYEIWNGNLVLDRLSLEEDDRISLAENLAILLPEKSAEIVERQLAGIDNPDRRRRLAFIAPSLAAEAAVRDAFFESLRDQRNRRTERWVSDALRNLHHPARLDHSQKYVVPSLELLQEIQVTGDIFFPTDWLEATLENHHSAEVAETVRRFLAQRPGYNPQLRMKILQAADPLFRASELRRRTTAVGTD
jgi:aminopeptidase N